MMLDGNKNKGVFDKNAQNEILLRIQNNFKASHLDWKNIHTFADYAKNFAEVIPAYFLCYDRSLISLTVTIVRIRIQSNFLNFEAFQKLNSFNNLNDFLKFPLYFSQIFVIENNHT